MVHFSECIKCKWEEKTLINVFSCYSQVFWVDHLNNLEAW